LGSAGCSSGQDQEHSGSSTQALSAPTLRRGQYLPATEAAAPAPAPAPRQGAPIPDAHLSYWGGRVVSNIQVVQVLYGAGSPGDYPTAVASTASPSIASFYQGVLNSPYVDWLTEYNTTTPLPTPRSDQAIGRGSFSTQVVITPSAANNGSTIDDSNIKAELAAQIMAGTLPAPTHDAAGNNNTYYAVFFPKGKVITLGVQSSCAFNGFCAYHGTIADAGGHGEVYYGVHPDMQSGSACAFLCGAAPTEFGNYTQVASHELIETVTDPEVGLASFVGPPLAWYDPSNTPDNGEIGDICNDQHATVTGGDGVVYDVQLEFSNSRNDCIAQASAANTAPVANAGADQTVTLPASATLAGSATDDGLPNPPGTLSFSWAKVSGPGTVTFANPALAATTATFSAAGSYVLRLTANDGALSGSDDVMVTVKAAPPPDPCTGLCNNPVSFGINGSFQSGPIGTGAVCLQTKAVVHGGNCGNFVSPRSLKVNGTTEVCNNLNWAAIPPARNGGYCIQTTAGNQPWAFITAW